MFSFPLGKYLKVEWEGCIVVGCSTSLETAKLLAKDVALFNK
jgi:hypothetical protein